MNDSSSRMDWTIFFICKMLKRSLYHQCMYLPHLCLSVLMIREFMLLRIDYNEWVGSPARLYLGLRLMQKVFSAHGKSWKSTFAAGRIWRKQMLWFVLRAYGQVLSTWLILWCLLRWWWFVWWGIHHWCSIQTRGCCCRSCSKQLVGRLRTLVDFWRSSSLEAAWSWWPALLLLDLSLVR